VSDILSSEMVNTTMTRDVIDPETNQTTETYYEMVLTRKVDIVNPDLMHFTPAFGQYVLENAESILE